MGRKRGSSVSKTVLIANATSENSRTFVVRIMKAMKKSENSEKSENYRTRKEQGRKRPSLPSLIRWLVLCDAGKGPRPPRALGGGSPWRDTTASPRILAQSRCSINDLCSWCYRYL